MEIFVIEMVPKIVILPALVHKTIGKNSNYFCFLSFVLFLSAHVVMLRSLWHEERKIDTRLLCSQQFVLALQLCTLSLFASLTASNQFT